MSGGPALTTNYRRRTKRAVYEQMKNFYVVFTIALVLVLTASLIERKMTMRRLEQQIRVLQDANSELRQTLGQLTIAITKKEKQIDDLQHFSPRRSPSKYPPSRKSFGA